MATFTRRRRNWNDPPRGPPLFRPAIKRATTASSAKNQAVAALTTTTPIRRSSWLRAL
jgi:hypothetical protein